MNDLVMGDPLLVGGIHGRSNNRIVNNTVYIYTCSTEQ